MQEMDQEIPVALTIAGSDSGGGAGIQADLRTFAANNVHGTSVITSVTAQNPTGVSASYPLQANEVSEQLKQTSDYFKIAAIKTGMLQNVSIIEAVSVFLEKNPGIACVVDPVMVASSGDTLLEKSALDACQEILLPKASLITPNLDECAALTGNKPDDLATLKSAANELADKYHVPVLLKGGHLDCEQLYDVLIQHDQEELVLECKRINNINTHGSGCTLSAAIAAHLAHGLSLHSAVSNAHHYLQQCLRSPIRIRGTLFINHFPKK